MKEDENLNKIRNLLGFNMNLNKYCDVGPLVKQSPDYILEKYNWWIGFEPVTEYSGYTPDNLVTFFHNYHKTWGDFTLVKRQLLYLQETESLEMTTMVNSFEKYFGPIELLSSERKTGLHHNLFRFSEEVLLANKKDLKIILRDMKLRELLKR